MKNEENVEFSPFLRLFVIFLTSRSTTSTTSGQRKCHPAPSSAVCPIMKNHSFFAYFCLVANPPRMCRSALLCSSTFFTSPYNCGLMAFNRLETSLCTVDLEMPKLLAASRTVDPCSTIYSPKITVRLSSVLILAPFSHNIGTRYAKISESMKKQKIFSFLLYD